MQEEVKVHSTVDKEQSSTVAVKDLIDAGVHFGHKTSKWCPKMKPYIWGARNKVYLIDVSKTAFMIKNACDQIRKVAASGGKILWVGTKKSAKDAIAKAGSELGMPYVSHRWIGGTLTNFDQVKKGVTKLLHLKDVVSKPMATLKKKEIGRISKEADRLEKNFGGIVTLTQPPVVLVIVDTIASETAIKEALYCNIPVIGIVDTNSDPSSLAIAIPANDDSQRSVGLLVQTLANAAAEGLAVFKKEEVERQKSVVQKAADKLKAKDGSENKADASKDAGKRRAPVQNRTVVKSASAATVDADKAVASSEDKESKE